MANYNSTSTKSSKITILYTYKETKVRRYAPVEIPMNAFNKDKGELKRGFDEKLPTQNKWIQKFKSCKNDLEIRMHNGEIEYEYAFRILKNDYESGIINNLYPDFAKQNRITKSVINNNIKKLVVIQNHFKRLGYKQYTELDYQHFQKITDRKNIELIILNEIDTINNATRKKYFNALNQIASVNTTFTKAEKNPFNIKLRHSNPPPKVALSSRTVKEGILKIGDNLYNLEAYLWWLYSFCLRGVDTCDIVCMNESMLECSNGLKGWGLKEYYHWELDKTAEDFSIAGEKVEGAEINNLKLYLIGKRVKLDYDKENRAEVKILYNLTPLLLIHKMLKKVISIIHPDLAYKGKDNLKLYNINYKTDEGKRTWHNRRGTMSDACKRMFGGTLKQARHTFSTLLSDIMSVAYNDAEKQLSTSLGHANEKAQRFYVNPNQDKMDILQIEVVERFGIRDIVENLIKICSTIQIKNQDGIQEPMLNEKLLKYSPLTIKASWWDWNKELKFQQLKNQQKSSCKFVQNKKSEWISKDVIEESAEFKAMKKERKIAHIDSVLDWNLDSIPVTED
tara:strand:+ start:460 stop:2154 length:1695 start_codon:yes stop_codon:yes gene_type:complete